MMQRNYTYEATPSLVYKMYTLFGTYLIASAVNFILFTFCAFYMEILQTTELTNQKLRADLNASFCTKYLVKYIICLLITETVLINMH